MLVVSKTLGKALPWLHQPMGTLEHMKMSLNNSDGSILECFDAGDVIGSKTKVRIHANGNSPELSHISPEMLSNQMDNTLTCLESDKMEPIAIIGLSLRFPQEATTPQTFWKMLMEKRSAMTDVPSERFNVSGFYDGGEHMTGMVRCLSNTKKCSGELC